MITAKWTGLQEALAKVEELGQELGSEKILVPALREQAKSLLTEVQVKLDQRDDPKTPEKLIDDFVIVQDSDGEGRPFFRVGPKAGKGSRGFIAWFLERGTSRMSAKPSVRPAYDAWAPGFGERMAVALRAKTDAVVRRLARKALRGAK